MITTDCCEVAVNIQEETYRNGMKALSAKSMKPSKLIRHLNTKHPNHATRSFFQRHKANLKRQRLMLPEVSTNAGIIWSRTWNCQVNNLTRLDKRLWNPCLLKPAKQLLGEASEANIRQISLSSDTNTNHANKVGQAFFWTVSCV